MTLEKIYRPIRKDLSAVEALIGRSVRQSRDPSILRIAGHLQSSRGKRLRPALVLLSARAVRPSRPRLSREVTAIAAAVELSHVASLVHDDVVDHSRTRRSIPTINSKWGEETSIIFGDYLYSLAFRLVSSSCSRPDILGCISRTTQLMCEGELTQIFGRDDENLGKERYFGIIRKKTADLFAASCQVGALAAGAVPGTAARMKAYGLSLGIAFQIADDVLDLIGGERDLGKAPGSDLCLGELTLPVLHLLDQPREKREIYPLIRRKKGAKAFALIRERFIGSLAYRRTYDEAASYVRRAKRCLNVLQDSPGKRSLEALADHLLERIRR